MLVDYYDLRLGVSKMGMKIRVRLDEKGGTTANYRVPESTSHNSSTQMSQNVMKPRSCQVGERGRSGTGICQTVTVSGTYPAQHCTEKL